MVRPAWMRMDCRVGFRPGRVRFRRAAAGMALRRRGQVPTGPGVYWGLVRLASLGAVRRGTGLAWLAWPAADGSGVCVLGLGRAG